MGMRMGIRVTQGTGIRVSQGMGMRVTQGVGVRVAQGPLSVPTPPTPDPSPCPGLTLQLGYPGKRLLQLRGSPLQLTLSISRGKGLETPARALPRTSQKRPVQGEGLQVSP